MSICCVAIAKLELIKRTGRQVADRLRMSHERVLDKSSMANSPSPSLKNRSDGNGDEIRRIQGAGAKNSTVGVTDKVDGSGAGMTELTTPPAIRMVPSLSRAAA
jgi:hypothetical protein